MSVRLTVSLCLLVLAVPFTDDHYSDEHPGASLRALRALHTKNSFTNADGTSIDWISYTGLPVSECMAYVIHGIEWARVEPLLRSGNAWQVCAATHPICMMYFRLTHRIVAHHSVA